MKNHAELIEMRPIDQLIPYARNSRTHSAAQIKQIENSIKRFGWTLPVLVDEGGMIIAGHGRIMAAKNLAIEMVPVVVATGWSEDDKRAYVIADNKIAENAEWDKDLLTLELSDLKSADYDLGITGFSKSDLVSFVSIKNNGLTDEDVVPVVVENPVSKVGDIWLLGGHRIMCGDSTAAEMVAALLADNKPNLMVTDPPYGVKYDPSWREGADLGVGERSKGLVLNDDRADWTEAWALFPGNIAYIWHGGLHSATVAQSLEACDFKMRAQIIWVKQHFVLSRGDYHWQHEPCWYAVRGTGDWQGDRKQTTTWDIKNNNSFGNSDKEETFGHGTQKPVECMRRPILNNSQPGQIVYEPFSGSGTTIIAAETTDRLCFAMELNPEYVDMAVKRWQDFTGKSATLEATGKTYDEVKHERA